MSTRTDWYAPLPVGFFHDPKTIYARTVHPRSVEGFLVLIAEAEGQTRRNGPRGEAKMAWPTYAVCLGVTSHAELLPILRAIERFGWIEIRDTDNAGFRVYLPSRDKWAGEGDAAGAARVAKYQATLRQAAAAASEGGTQTVFDPEHIRLANLLATLILQRDPKANVAPQSARWLNAIRLLNARDGRSLDEIAHVIRWCQADTFWRTNILSAPTLRKQFDKLAAKAGAPAHADLDGFDKRMGVE